MPTATNSDHRRIDPTAGRAVAQDAAHLSTGSEMPGRARHLPSRCSGALLIIMRTTYGATPQREQLVAVDNVVTAATANSRGVGLMEKA